MMIAILVGLMVLVTAQEPPRGVVTGPAAPVRLEAAGSDVAQAGAIALSDGYVMVSMRSGAARGGFAIRNDGEAPDRLLSVSSPMADSVTVWRIDLTGAAAREVEQPSIEIAPRSAVMLDGAKSDPNHGRLRLRFEGLRPPENPADGVPVTLVFERAGSVTVRAFQMIPVQ